MHILFNCIIPVKFTIHNTDLAFLMFNATSNGGLRVCFDSEALLVNHHGNEEDIDNLESIIKACFKKYKFKVPSEKFCTL